MRLEPLGQHRGGGLGVGVEVDDEEVADVVPRRRRDEARPAARRARDGVALERHAFSRVWSGTPCISRLSRSDGDRGLVEAEVGARRQRAPGVGRVAVVRPARAARGRPRAAPCRSTARRSTPPRRSARTRRCCRRRRGASGPSRASGRGGRGGRARPHLPDVDDVEGEVVEVRVALVHERHDVVVGADVQPHAAVAEPVGQPHAEHVDVEVLLLVDARGEEVDVAELARVAERDARRPARAWPTSRDAGSAYGSRWIALPSRSASSMWPSTRRARDARAPSRCAPRRRASSARASS